MKKKTGFIENAILIVILAAVLGFVVWPTVWNHFKKNEVLENGTDGTATILKIVDTGKRFNTNPIVEMTLLVMDARGKEFRAVVTTPLSPVRLSRYQKGTMVKIRYDEQSPERVALVPEKDTIRE